MSDLGLVGLAVVILLGVVAPRLALVLLLGYFVLPEVFWWIWVVPAVFGLTLDYIQAVRPGWFFRRSR